MTNHKTELARAQADHQTALRQQSDDLLRKQDEILRAQKAAYAVVGVSFSSSLVRAHLSVYIPLCSLLLSGAG